VRTYPWQLADDGQSPSLSAQTPSSSSSSSSSSSKVLVVPNSAPPAVGNGCDLVAGFQ
jgi:hypothetical protein